MWRIKTTKDGIWLGRWILHSATQFHPFSTLPWDDQYPLFPGMTNTLYTIGPLIKVSERGSHVGRKPLCLKIGVIKREAAERWRFGQFHIGRCQRRQRIHQRTIEGAFAQAAADHKHIAHMHVSLCSPDRWLHAKRGCVGRRPPVRLRSFR